jgi:uncharacterized repeat protein (TIGR01451 family)
MNRPFLVTIGLLAVSTLAHAQDVPTPLANQLMFVRFNGPPGLKVTFFRDGTPHEYEIPVSVGLRPGYVYRVRVTGLPGRPNAALYPTIEVQGNLRLLPKYNASEHPATLNLTELDIAAVFDHALLTKVVYLEHPEKTLPEARLAGEVPETVLPASADLLAKANEVGRPVLVMRVGDRTVERADLEHFAVPGTVLLPTEKALSAPRLPPMLPFVCWPAYDPLLGPKRSEEECFNDGGDMGTRAGIRPDGKLGGLDPSDTVAEYTDAQGCRHVVPSNRICICAPRYSALRTELPLAGYKNTTNTVGEQATLVQAQLGMRLPSRSTAASETVAGIRARQRPSGAVAEQGVRRLTRIDVLNAVQITEGLAMFLGTERIESLSQTQRTRLKKQVEFVQSLYGRSQVAGVQQTMGASVVGRVEGLAQVETTQEIADVTAICDHAPELLIEKPLFLCKWADRDCGQPGDTVTIFLRYTNNGRKPVTDVAVTDSLTTRLEYVPTTAKSDHNAVFTIQENEAGSVILRWEITGKLMPGETGVVSFVAKIRYAASATHDLGMIRNRASAKMQSHFGTRRGRSGMSPRVHFCRI